MIWLIVILGAIAAAFALAVVAYARELKRISHFLEDVPEGSNLRLDTDLPLPETERLINAVNQQLDESAERALRMRQEESDLLEGLANLSHDIRTPLAGAKGYVQLASEEADRQEAQRFLSLAQTRLDAMRVMLDQLFDYMRTIGSREEYETESVDAIAVLSSVLAGHYPAFAKVGWEPRLELQDETLPIQTNPEALRRIFDNIVANMLAHGAGDICVQQTSGKDAGEVSGSLLGAGDAHNTQVTTILTFSNRLKPGDNPDPDLVLKRFYRSDAARSTAGAGLGLAVVKELCAVMDIGIEVAVQNETFAVVLSFV